MHEVIAAAPSAGPTWLQITALVCSLLVSVSVIVGITTRWLRRKVYDMIDERLEQYGKERP